MKKRIKDLTLEERNEICGKYLSKHCHHCPLARPYYEECEYEHIHDLLKHFEKEVEVDE